MPGAWLTASVWTLFTKHRRSAIRAVWGSSSLTQAPLRPRRWKGSIGARSSLPSALPVMVLNRFPPT